MQVRFMKDEPLYLLKKSINNNIHNYELDNSEWIKEVTGMSENFVVFKKEFPDFDLISSSDVENCDLENIKIIYSSMKELSDSQASDERLWAGLCHDKFWDYMQKRWPLDKAKDKEKYIKKNYFFAHGENRSLMTNAIARLWWIGRLTYDETLTNPFELTEYLAKDLNGRGFPLFGSNFSNNKKILKIFLTTIKEYEINNNKNLSREQFLELIKTMNLWGGKILIDFLPEDKLKERILLKINEVYSKN